jgi:FtsZ-binding cell division protein ZapB
MEGKHKELQRQVDEEKQSYDTVHAETAKLEARVEKLEADLSKAKGLMILEKERYEQLLSTSKEEEMRMTRELKEAQDAFAKRETEMGDEIASMRLQLKEAMDASKDIEGARVRNQRLRVETERLKRKLKASKSYSLHKALNATMSSSKEHADKLHSIIAHLQREQQDVNARAERLTAERNVMRDELVKAEERRRALLGALTLTREAGRSTEDHEAFAAAADARAEAEVGGSDSGGAKRAQAALWSDSGVVGGAEVLKMHDELARRRREIRSLREKVIAEQSEHESREEELRIKMETERDALLKYAQHLEGQKACIDAEKKEHKAGAWRGAGNS